MLAALDDSIVVSEAAPIDAVVQLGRGLPEDDAARALRAIVAAFGRKRGGRERRYFVKLDCWHTLALPLFRRAFPAVPWIFLYRDPAEVLVSQMRERGSQMVPQFFPPDFFGIAAAETIAAEDYCARVLAAICRAVLDHRHLGGGLILNYRQLPDAVWTAMLPHFGMSCSGEEQDTMRRAAAYNAKSPGMPFTGDSEGKQRAITAKVRDAAARHLGEIYERLEFCARGLRCKTSVERRHIGHALGILGGRHQKDRHRAELLVLHAVEALREDARVAGEEGQRERRPHAAGRREGRVQQLGFLERQRNRRHAVLADDKNLVDLVGEILEDKPTLRHGAISSGFRQIVKQLYRRWQLPGVRGRQGQGSSPGYYAKRKPHHNSPECRREKPGGNHDATPELAQHDVSASGIAVWAGHISVLCR